MEVLIGPLGKMHIGQMIFQTGAEIALAEGKIIESTFGKKYFDDLLRFLRRNTVGHPFVARHFQAHQEIGTTARADTADHLVHEGQTAQAIAAIFIVAIVGER